jgi:hypothetical protein
VTGWRKAYLSALWVWYRSELTITEPGYTRGYIHSQIQNEMITENVPFNADSVFKVKAMSLIPIDLNADTDPAIKIPF